MVPEPDSHRLVNKPLPVRTFTQLFYAGEYDRGNADNRECIAKTTAEEIVSLVLESEIAGLTRPTRDDRVTRTAAQLPVATFSLENEVGMLLGRPKLDGQVLLRSSDRLAARLNLACSTPTSGRQGHCNRETVCVWLVVCRLAIGAHLQTLRQHRQQTLHVPVVAPKGLYEGCPLDLHLSA